VRTINHSAVCAGALLTAEPVRRALVIHASRPLYGLCTPEDLDFLRQHRPQPDDEEEADDQAGAGNGQGSRAAMDPRGDWVTRSAGRTFAVNGSGTTFKATPAAREFLVKNCGLDPLADDEEAANHFSRLHPDMQKTCREFAENEGNEKDADRGGDRGGGSKITKYVRGLRHFLQRATGLSDFATDDEARAHLDTLSAPLQEAARSYAESEMDEDDENEDEDADAQRTSYLSAGPDRQADTSAAGPPTMPLRVHSAVFLPPPGYTESSPAEIIEAGIAVATCRNPETMDERPAAVSFDPAKFDEQACLDWLAAHHLDASGFQAADISDGDETRRAAMPTAGDVERAGQELELALALDGACDFLDGNNPLADLVR